MKNKPAILLSLTLVCLASGQVPDFSGTWETTYGTLYLQQDSTFVTGYYNFSGMSTIEGTVNSNGRLVFRYAEPSAAGDGWFELSADSLIIQGSWSADGTANWYDWEGYRAGSDAALGSKWLVILESEWQTGLAENEYSFGEMLAAWFTRVPSVTVRHRFIHDIDDLTDFCLEASALPGEVYLVISSHGTVDGISLSSGSVTAREFSNAIAPCSNLAMIHFSCCLIMAGEIPNEIINSRDWGEEFLVSGYTRSVDWGASGIIEMYYFNQIFDAGYSPLEAARSVIEDIVFAEIDTNWTDATGFTWINKR